MNNNFVPHRWRRLLACALLVLGACAGDGGKVPGQPPHHREGGSFQNNYVEFEPKGLIALARWQVASWRDGLPRPPATPTPLLVPDLGLIQSNAKAGAHMQPAVTWRWPG
jgi:N-acyl-phosphatidylethanolamine-hydrolysing phospholipase D